MPVHEATIPFQYLHAHVDRVENNTNYKSHTGNYQIDDCT